MVKTTAFLAVLATASLTWAAPILVIDGDGNAAGTFAASDTELQLGQTVDGLGAAVFTFASRNGSVTFTASNPRPVLGDNSILSAEVYVTATEVSECSQGENRIKITFRDPTDGTQSSVWAGASGGAGGSGLQWFPAANTWTTFTYDLTQESWWADGYSTWEIYRVYAYENDDADYSNTFALRNLQFTVPEPATAALATTGLLCLLARRRNRR